MKESHRYFFLKCDWKPPFAFAEVTFKGKDWERKATDNLINMEGAGTLPHDFKLIKLVESDIGFIESHDPVEESLWKDFLDNTHKCPMLSERAKRIIEQHLTGEEGIVWVSCHLRTSTESRVYYMPLFTILYDFYIDTPSVDKVKGQPILHEPLRPQLPHMDFKPKFYHNNIPSDIYVNATIRTALEEANLVGLTFEEVILK